MHSFSFNLCTGILYNMAWNNNIDSFFLHIQAKEEKIPANNSSNNSFWAGLSFIQTCIYLCIYVYVNVCTQKHVMDTYCTHTDCFLTSLCLFCSISHSNSPPAFPPSCNARLAFLSASPWWQGRNSRNKLLCVLLPLSIFLKVKLWKTEMYLYRARTTTFITPGKWGLDEKGGNLEGTEQNPAAVKTNRNKRFFRLTTCLVLLTLISSAWPMSLGMFLA